MSQVHTSRVPSASLGVPERTMRPNSSPNLRQQQNGPTITAPTVPSLLTNTSNVSTNGDSATPHVLIQRLKSAIEFQENHLRNLREPLFIPAGPTRSGGAYSTAASSYNASSVMTPSLFHVASKKRWCNEFQWTVNNVVRNKQLQLCEKLKKINQCLQEFEKEAEGVGRSFLERYLGDEAYSDRDGNATERGDTGANSNGHSSASPSVSNSSLQASQQRSPRSLGVTSPPPPPVPNSPTSNTFSQFRCDWATATQLGRGEFLTITLLDCEDNTAAASASKEQQSHMRFLAHQVATLPEVLLHVFPRCIVQWRGRILLVSAQSLHMGSSEPETVTDNAELALVMDLISDSSMLTRYFKARDDDDDSDEVLVSGHPSASVRPGYDGRLYLQSLSTVFPHFPPARGASISKRHVLYLRPEAVMREDQKHRLSPGAFLVYGSRDSTAQNSLVRECAQKVCQTTVQRVADILMGRAKNVIIGPDRRESLPIPSGGPPHRRNTSSNSIAATTAAGQEVSAAPVPRLGDGPGLSAFLHSHGVNIGMLGLLMTFLSGDMLVFAFTEMISRVSRDYLRNNMSKRIELDDTCRVVSEFFAEMSRPESFHALWQDELFGRAAKKFAGYGSFFSEHATHPPFDVVDRNYLVLRVPQLLGIVFAAGVNGQGSTSFHFSVRALATKVRSFPVACPFGYDSVVQSKPPSAAAVPSSAPSTPRLAIVSDSSNSPRWIPAHIASRWSMYNRLAQCASACDSTSSVVAAPRLVLEATSTVVRSVSMWVQSTLSFLQKVIPATLMVPSNSVNYAAVLLDAARFLRGVEAGVGGVDAIQASEGYQLAVEYCKSAMSILRKFGMEGADPSTSPDVSVTKTNSGAISRSSNSQASAMSLLFIVAEAELGFCLIAARKVAEGIKTLDKAFQHAAAIGPSSMSVTTPRAARSATSSVECQYLQAGNPNGVTPHAAVANWNPIHRGSGVKLPSSASGGGPKMSVSIIAAFDDDADTGANVQGSCAASTAPQDSEGAPSRRRSNDAMSLSDLDGPNGGASSPERGFIALAADIATEFGNLLEKENQFSEAEALHRYALSTALHLFGTTHPAVSNATNNLAVNLFSQRKLEEAEALYREDLRVCEALYGPNDLSVGGTLNNLACLLDQLDRFEESEALYLRDIKISEVSLGLKHPDVATSKNNLGTSYLRRGQLEKAQGMFDSALAIREETFGKDAIPTAEVLNNMAALRKREGRSDVAKVLWERCVAIYSEKNGEHHTSLLPLLECLCLVCEDVGDYVRSEELMEKAFMIKQSESMAFAESS